MTGVPVVSPSQPDVTAPHPAEEAGVEAMPEPPPAVISSGDSMLPHADSSSAPEPTENDHNEPGEIPIPNDDTPTDDDDELHIDHHERMQDYWEHRGKHVIRHHVRPRLKLFMPSDESQLPVPLHRLSKARWTQGSYRHGGNFQRGDQWNESVTAHQYMPEIWTGQTKFEVIDTQEMTSQENQETINSCMNTGALVGTISSRDRTMHEEGHTKNEKSF